MAITYVGGSILAASSANTNDIVSIPLVLSGGIDTQPSNGDIVIISISNHLDNDQSPGVTTSGYTEIAELFVNDGVDTNLSVSWKRIGSTPDTSVEVTGISTASNGGSVVVIKVYRGVDSTTPFDVTSTTTAATNSAIPRPSSISPITAGTRIVIAAASGHDRGTSGWYIADYLSNFSSLAVDTVSRDGTSGMGDVVWNSGTYTPPAWVFGSTDNVAYSNATVTMALRPAATFVDTLTSTAIVIESYSLSNPTLADIPSGPTPLASSDVMTYAPTLGAATLVATSILASTNTYTGNASVGTTTVSQIHALSGGTIATATPAVSTATLAISNAIGTLSITSGVPALGSATVTTTNYIPAINIVTGQPTTASATMSQVHKLTSNAVTSGNMYVQIAIAFSQGAFNSNYERKRTVFVMRESRVVVL